MSDSPKNIPAASLTFNGQTAVGLMTPNPVSVREAATIGEALALLVNKGISAVPVINEAGRPLGVLSYSDLLVHERETAVRSGLDVQSYGGSDLAGRSGRGGGGWFPAAEADRCRVREVMTPAVFAVPADAAAASVVEQLVELNVHRLFVVDTDGILVGVITPLDVLRHLRSKPPVPPDNTPAPPPVRSPS
jgi:CBS domain-containing protein